MELCCACSTWIRRKCRGYRVRVRHFRCVPRYFVGLMDGVTIRWLACAAPWRQKTKLVAGSTRPGRRPGIITGQRHPEEVPRTLMITTGACAVHCRYCFRRHFPYNEQSVLRHWQAALDRLRDLPDTDN